MRMPKKMFEPYDDEERDLIKAIEDDNYKTLPENEKQKLIEKIQKLAKEDNEARRQQINLRVPIQDVAALKEKAAETGVPYQTIIGALIRQYIQGKLKLEL